MKHCLVVDSSSVIRKVARRVLETCGWTVTEAANGQEALDHCKIEMPDILLVDWMLPAMPTFELIPALRMMPQGRHPAVIYMTTRNDPVDISRALSIGADDYLLKPFERHDIKEKVDAYQRAA